MNFDRQKARLVQQSDFSYSDAFAAIDKYNSGVINYDNLKAFLYGQAQ